MNLDKLLFLTEKLILTMVFNYLKMRYPQKNLVRFIEIYLQVDVRKFYVGNNFWFIVFLVYIINKRLSNKGPSFDEP